MTVQVVAHPVDGVSCTQVVAVVCTTCKTQLAVLVVTEVERLASVVDKAHRCPSLLKSDAFASAVEQLVAGQRGGR